MKKWEVLRYKIYLAVMTLFVIALIYLLLVKANLLFDFWNN